MKLFVLVFIYILFCITIIQEFLVWFNLFQRKEYRLDRLKDFFSSNEGLTLLKKHAVYVVFFIIFVGIDFGVHSMSISGAVTFEMAIIPLLLFSFFALIQGFFLIKTLVSRKLIRPRPTLRIGVAMATTSFILLVIILFKSFFIFTYIEASLLFFFVTVPLFSGLGVLMTHPLSLILKKRIIRHAIQKRTRLRNLKVIGITGSYGKTSVKEYLYEVLKSHFSVVKTEEHVNTEIGVAKTLLEKVSSQTEIFIVEMGAYKKGEIAAITTIVKPDIGVITGINEQHLSLFGSIENIMQAKAELIFSLPKNGFAVLNKDNAFVEKISHKVKVKKYFFSKRKKTDITLIHVHSTPDGEFFSVGINGSKYDFKTKLFGEHSVYNLLPVIIVARKFGIPIVKIQKSISRLKGISRNMEVLKDGKNVIINNTYNLNPASLDAFISMIRPYESKTKILILDDILELGNEARHIHRAIAKKILGKIDILVLVGKNYPQIIQRELIGSPLSEKVTVTRDASVISKIIDKEKEAVIGFLGRGTTHIFTELYE